MRRQGRLLNEPPRFEWGLEEVSLVFLFVGALSLFAAFNMTEARNWLPAAIGGGLFFSGGLTGLIVCIIRDRKQ
jgi:hypothetical protein